MESAGKYKIVIYGELVEGAGEVSLVDETTGFVDDYEGIDHPGKSVSFCSWKARNTD